MSSSRAPELWMLYDRNQDATLYIGNVDTQVDEELLWEFFIQTGHVKNVHIPRDKVTGQHQGYAFVEFEKEEDAEYAMRVLNFVKLYNKPLKINKAARDKQNHEIGANLFVGNLGEDVDDKMIHEAFGAFGAIVSAKVVRDGEGPEGKTYAFVSFDNFEASDAALAAMNGQFFCNRPIHVSYAYKRDTKGERHGSAAERLIAANRPPQYPQAAPHGLLPQVPQPSGAPLLPPPIAPSVLGMPAVPGASMPPPPPYGAS